MTCGRVLTMSEADEYKRELVNETVEAVRDSGTAISERGVQDAEAGVGDSREMLNKKGRDPESGPFASEAASEAREAKDSASERELQRRQHCEHMSDVHDVVVDDGESHSYADHGAHLSQDEFRKRNFGERNKDISGQFYSEDLHGKARDAWLSEHAEEMQERAEKIRETRGAGLHDDANDMSRVTKVTVLDTPCGMIHHRDESKPPTHGVSEVQATYRYSFDDGRWHEVTIYPYAKKY